MYSFLRVFFCICYKILKINIFLMVQNFASEWILTYVRFINNFWKYVYEIETKKTENIS